ncbi:MAG: nucleoside deaminase [Bacteroidetes bacterium]|jgi:tRNA(Arg) A34 adenosine deaminase TadA|nr:nucleoside deaminase [Bacteroidota bacterium]
MIKPDIHIMKAAIEIAEKHSTPFGAALALGDEIFVTAANQTKTLHDPTAHAELLAIRKLSDRVRKTDLSGFSLYTTCEPCPMCMSAAIWAKIDTVFYGCGIPSISKKMPQIDIRSIDINKKSFHNVTILGGVLENRCMELLKQFS